MTSAPPRTNRSAALIRPCDLPEKVQAGLRSGHKHEGYRSHRTLLFAVILSAIHRGFTYTEISNSFRHGSLQSVAVTRWQVAGGHPRVERELQKLYDAAGEKVATARDRRLGTFEAVQLREAVEVLALRDRGGPSERAVLTVIADAGVEQGTTTPRVSRLEMAIATGKSTSVVEEALQRLLRREFLSRIEPGGIDRRAQWSITTKAVMAANRGLLVNPVAHTKTDLGLVPSPGHDVWSQLGLVAWEVLRLLTTVGPHTANDAATVLGRNPHVVRRHLKRLAEDHTLVTRDSDRVWTARVDADTLTQAAQRCGVEGAGRRHEQRVRAHAAETRVWLDQREEAVSTKLRFEQARSAYADSSFRGYTSTGGLVFVCIDIHALTFPRWKAAGSPEDFRDALPEPLKTALRQSVR